MLGAPYITFSLSSCRFLPLQCNVDASFHFPTDDLLSRKFFIGCPCVRLWPFHMSHWSRKGLCPHSFTQSHQVHLPEGLGETGDKKMVRAVRGSPNTLQTVFEKFSRRRDLAAIRPNCTCTQHIHTLGKSPRREVVRSSAGTGVVYPPFWGHSRSIPQGMILDVQRLLKSLFCP